MSATSLKRLGQWKAVQRERSAELARRACVLRHVADVQTTATGVHCLLVAKSYQGFRNRRGAAGEVFHKWTLSEAMRELHFIRYIAH